MLIDFLKGVQYTASPVPCTTRIPVTKKKRGVYHRVFCISSPGRC